MWELYTVLSRVRPAGWGIEPIPMPAIAVVLDEWGYTDPEVRQDIVELITRMDAEHRKLAEAQQETKKAGAGGGRK